MIIVSLELTDLPYCCTCLGRQSPERQHRSYLEAVVKQSQIYQRLDFLIYKEINKLERILTMVYVVQNSQNFSGFFPLSGIPKNTTFWKLDLFPSSDVGGGEVAYPVRPFTES
jgi:hypothetical protein